MKGLTAADRTIAALRVACRAKLDWHAERHPYRVRQAERWWDQAAIYAAGMGSPCHGQRALALRMACEQRALAYQAAAKGDAFWAWSHWKAMRGLLRHYGLTAKVWKR